MLLGLQIFPLSAWESLAVLVVGCCLCLLAEEFSRVFFKLSSLAKHRLKLKGELGVGQRQRCPWWGGARRGDC